jgi:septal ring factor EnvC (AmiA/AmiB activator)
MTSIKTYLERMRRNPFSRTRALEQELEAVRKAHALVSADLGKMRETFLHVRETDAQRLVDLQQQVGQFAHERDHAHGQVEQLEHALVDAEQRQKSMETKIDTLNAELKAERDHARQQVEHLEHALSEAEQSQKSLQAHIGLLESKIEAEHVDMHRQVEQLGRVVADTEQRQKSTQAQMGSLETMLKEERASHQSGINATEDFLVRMRDEQEARLKLQSELTDTLQDVVLRLQGTMQFQRERPNASLPKLVFMAVVLFVAGALAATFVLQSRQREDGQLAAVERRLNDLGQLMNQQIDKQDALLGELSRVREQQTLVEPAPVQEKPPVPEVQGEEIPPRGAVAFKPDFTALQAGLITLGFDLGIARPDGQLGIKTRQALQEFKQLYLPDAGAQGEVVSEQLEATILKSADRVRADVARFGIGNDVLGAIRLGSIRTGVDFTFLMEMARVESNFNPAARAPRSSATGLFQFRDQAWLEAIREFGAEYGLKDYANKVRLIEDEDHEPRPIVRDPLQLEVLALRLNPRLSTLMAAENIKRNLQLLSGKTRQEPGRTELYLAHYLGPEGAVKFLKTMDEEPSAIAATIFPEEAARDPAVFRGEQQHPRTVAQVYHWLERKFKTARYDERTLD